MFRRGAAAAWWSMTAVLGLLLPSTPARAGDAVADLVIAAKTAGCTPSAGACGGGLFDRLPGGKLIGGLFARTGAHDCVNELAGCLGGRGAAARTAVPALVRVLADGPNDYDTGDGTVAARSHVAAALGAIGDPAAIDPLADALRDARPADTGPGAIASDEPAAREALVAALARFGPAAARARGIVETVLRERNGEVGEQDRRRQVFERMYATRLAVETERAKRPGETRFTVPEAAILAAIRGLDRDDPAYVREFELFVEDRLATACADALAAMKGTESLPLLAETLRRPAAAASAARAIARLAPPRTGRLERALIDVLEAPAYGPAARAAACAALATLGPGAGTGGDPGDLERVIAALVRALEVPDVSAPAAEALAGLGPAARGALPALVRLAMVPAGAERTPGGGVRYGADATARLSARRAAVRAIAAIDRREAAARLSGLVADQEIGPAVRRAISGR